MWLEVHGYPDYEVSDLGDVRRITPTYHKSRAIPFLLKARPNSTGYPTVSLTRDRKAKTHYVHNLVASAFLGPRPSPDQQVAHLDGTRTNNAAINLKWVSPSENQAHKLGHGTLRAGENAYNAKLDAATVLSLRNESPSCISAAARRIGVATTTLRNALSGKTWRHINPDGTCP
jgi:hypothetical protein